MFQIGDNFHRIETEYEFYSNLGRLRALSFMKNTDVKIYEMLIQEDLLEVTVE